MPLCELGQTCCHMDTQSTEGYFSISAPASHLCSAPMVPSSGDLPSVYSLLPSLFFHLSVGLVSPPCPFALGHGLVGAARWAQSLFDFPLASVPPATSPPTPHCSALWLSWFGRLARTPVHTHKRHHVHFWSVMSDGDLMEGALKPVSWA